MPVIRLILWKFVNPSQHRSPPRLFSCCNEYVCHLPNYQHLFRCKFNATEHLSAWHTTFGKRFPCTRKVHVNVWLGTLARSCCSQDLNLLLFRDLNSSSCNWFRFSFRFFSFFFFLFFGYVICRIFSCYGNLRVRVIDREKDRQQTE